MSGITLITCSTSITNNIFVLIYILVLILNHFRRVRKIAKSDFVMSVRPHGTTRLPPDGFLCNLIFQFVSKICLEI